jgi:NAD(P)-dependent dehydrogenase (short-subunit alcohol dehydrogenase family)
VVGRGEEWEKMIGRIPLQRAGTAEEVADCIAFLCTRAASYIQGQCININGGLVMEH